MKHFVQILLLFAFTVTLSGAEEQEETMEERKKRIARKYLRERVDITYSEEVVPEDRPEFEEALASDEANADVEFERQEPGRPMPPPPMRQPPPRRADSNWLLSETPDSQDSYDSYDDPYMLKDDTSEPEEKDWTGWPTEGGADSYFNPTPDRRSDPRNDPVSREPTDRNDSYRRGADYPPRSRYGEQRSGGPSYVNPYRTQQEPRREGYTPYRNPYQAQQESQQDGYTPYRNPYQTQQDGYTPYRSPYQTQQEPQTQRERSDRRRNPVPYSNPYQRQYRQQRSQQEGSTDPNQQYRREDPFKQWKKYNPRTFDPTGDDGLLKD